MNAIEHAIPIGGRGWVEAASRPRWGIRELLLIAWAGIYPFHFYVGSSTDQVNFSLGDAVVALVGAGLFVGLLAGRSSLPGYTKAVFVFVLVTMASFLSPLLRSGSLPFSFDPTVGALAIAKFVGSALWMIALYALLRPSPFDGIRTFSTVSIVAAGAFAVTTIHESLVLPGTRPSGPFENENLYANYLSLNLFLATMLAQWSRDHGGRGVRLPTWLVVPILLVGILATGSRGAIIGAAVTYPLAFRWRWPHRLSVKRIAAILATLGLSGYGLVMFWQANSFIAGRVSGVLSGEGPNIDNREDLWRAALDAFRASPLVGQGYGQFPQYAEGVRGLNPTVTHDTYLSVAAELGLMGLLAFAWLLFVVIRDGVRTSRKPGMSSTRLLVLFVLATLAQGLFADVEHYRSLWVAFAMLAALGTAARAMGAPEASAREGLPTGDPQADGPSPSGVAPVPGFDHIRGRARTAP